MLEMGIPVPEDKKKLVRQEDRAREDDETETGYGAGDPRVKPAQLA